MSSSKEISWNLLEGNSDPIGGGSSLVEGLGFRGLGLEGSHTSHPKKKSHEARTGLIGGVD